MDQSSLITLTDAGLTIARKVYNRHKTITRFLMQLGVDEDEDILLITDEGTIIRMHVADIRESGRATQGVRLMRLGEDTKIVGVARAEKEAEEEADEAEFEASVESAEGTEE